MEKYLFLFRNTPYSEDAFQALSPEMMQAEIARWTNWIGGIAAQGKLISTEGLYPHGKTISTANHIVTDGPYTDAKEVVGGFMLLTAENMDDAVEMSKGCPSLADGGSVEIRVIQNFDAE